MCRCCMPSRFLWGQFHFLNTGLHRLKVVANSGLTLSGMSGFLAPVPFYSGTSSTVFIKSKVYMSNRSTK